MTDMLKTCRIGLEVFKKFDERGLFVNNQLNPQYWSCLWQTCYLNLLVFSLETLTTIGQDLNKVSDWLWNIVLSEFKNEEFFSVLFNYETLVSKGGLQT